MSNIDAMEAGRDLDALVAESVMRLSKDDFLSICIVECHGTDDDTWCYNCHGLVDEQDKIPPAYSTDIAAAWQVVERLNALRWYVVLLTGPVKAMPSVRLEQLQDSGMKVQVENTRAETISLAICRAALKAVGYEPIT